MLHAASEGNVEVAFVFSCCAEEDKKKGGLCLSLVFWGLPPREPPVEEISMRNPLLSSVERANLVKEETRNTALSLVGFTHPLASARAFCVWQAFETFSITLLARRACSQGVQSHLGCWFLLSKQMQNKVGFVCLFLYWSEYFAISRKLKFEMPVACFSKWPVEKLEACLIKRVCKTFLWHKMNMWQPSCYCDYSTCTLNALRAQES